MDRAEHGRPRWPPGVRAPGAADGRARGAGGDARAHDAVVVVSRGERSATVLGLRRLRTLVFPVMLAPCGFATVLTPPLPSSISVEFLPALDRSDYGPEAADDDEIVDACHDDMAGLVQTALDRLHGRRPHPVIRGCSNILRPWRQRLAVPEVVPVVPVADGGRGPPTVGVASGSGPSGRWRCGRRRPGRPGTTPRPDRAATR